MSASEGHLSSHERDKGTLLFERRYNSKAMKIHMRPDGGFIFMLTNENDNWLYETNSAPRDSLSLTDSLINLLVETLIGCAAVEYATKVNGRGLYDTRDWRIDARIDERINELVDEHIRVLFRKNVAGWPNSKGVLC
jgi:hypothetical protein